METDETPGVIITLVHGTWGRTRLPFSPPNWFEPESSFTGCFSQELASRNIQAAIHPFLWSGKNSLFARSEASVKLTQLIEKNAEKHPSAKQVIVGHSHGGSVALLAVRKLWTNVDPIIVTLATPFMEIVKSPPVGEEAKIKRYIATALPSVGLLLTLIWLFGVLNVHAYDQTLAFTGAFVLALRLLPSLYGVGKVDPPSELDWLAPATHRSDVYQALTVGGATLVTCSPDCPRL
jgi:pimeloyl-ACP methyl ester carboxylesterase